MNPNNVFSRDDFTHHPSDDYTPSGIPEDWNDAKSYLIVLIICILAGCLLGIIGYYLEKKKKKIYENINNAFTSIFLIPILIIVLVGCYCLFALYQYVFIEAFNYVFIDHFFIVLIVILSLILIVIGYHLTKNYIVIPLKAYLKKSSERREKRNKEYIKLWDDYKREREEKAEILKKEEEDRRNIQIESLIEDLKELNNPFTNDNSYKIRRKFAELRSLIGKDKAKDYLYLIEQAEKYLEKYDKIQAKDERKTCLFIVLFFLFMIFAFGVIIYKWKYG